VSTPVDAAPVLTPSFLSSVSTVFGGQIACAVIALMIEVLCSRTLGPAGRGQIALCAMVTAFGTMLGGLGGEIPIILWSAKARETLSQWMPAVFLCGLLGAAAVSALWLVAYRFWHPAFLRGVTPTLAAIVAVAIPANIFFNDLVAVLTGFERFRLRAVVAFATQIAELVSIVVLMAFVSRTAIAAVAGMLIGLAVGGVIACVSLGRVIALRWDLRGASERLLPALSLGVRGQLGNLATFFTYRLDVFIVNFFLGPADVGIYAVGVVVAEALWQVPQAAAVALFPRTARTEAEGSVEFTCSVSRHVLLIATLTGVALAIAAPILIPLVFGARFSSAVAVVWWILPGTIALSLGKLMSADLAGRSKPQYSSAFALVSLAVTVLLDFLLIPRMGIRGAALASSVAYLVDSLLLTAKLRQLLGVRWSDLLIPNRADFAGYRELWVRHKHHLQFAFASGAAKGGDLK
jgi:O-antigen/teichoic acid export membrane protein